MKQTQTNLQKYFAKSNYTDKTFTDSFNSIIEEKIQGYNGTAKQQLKSFFEDLQYGGCQSGIIGEFIYNSDCKDFYINHIDDLEEMREDLEEQLGESIQNRNRLPHYVFMVWLCFEEYCHNLYSNIFES